MMISDFLSKSIESLDSLWNSLIKWPIVFFVILGVFLGVSSPDVFSNNVRLLLANPVAFYNESHRIFVLYATLVAIFVSMEVWLFFKAGVVLSAGHSSNSCCGESKSALLRPEHGNTKDTGCGKPMSAQPRSEHGNTKAS